MSPVEFSAALNRGAVPNGWHQFAPRPLSELTQLQTEQLRHDLIVFWRLALQRLLTLDQRLSEAGFDYSYGKEHLNRNYSRCR